MPLNVHNSRQDELVGFRLLSIFRGKRYIRKVVTKSLHWFHLLLLLEILQYGQLDLSQPAYITIFSHGMQCSFWCNVQGSVH